jgi:hypothetical protein
MTQMFEEYSLINTVKNNLGNKYGVLGGSIKFGYIPDPQIGRDYKVDDLKKELSEILKP